MATWYNRIAGQSMERLAALSDGIFAVAMTLLVLDIHAPAAHSVHSENDLWRELCGLAPRMPGLLDELHDARHLLGWPANAIQPAFPIQPASHMDPHRVSSARLRDAVFY